ncbi:MAG: ThuA domain-containing protein, partial [Acidobacteriota bacterium]
MIRILSLSAVALVLGCVAPAPSEPGLWVVYDGYEGPGSGKHIVLISGDEEYRSEEALPQLGKILALRHGFKCTVLFAIDPEDGTINPEKVDNIPGLESLETADLMIIATRFRELPDEQMRHIDGYLNSGRPVIGMRTATHAFNYSPESTSPYRRYSFRSEEWDRGFGRQILGETWVSHHGHHAVQSTRGVIAEGEEGHPIVQGCEDIWGPTDVYEVHLPDDCEPLVMGQVLTGMAPGDPPVEGAYQTGDQPEKCPNDPMMPIAWIREYVSASGKSGRVFTTTMGAAEDLS